MDPEPEVEDGPGAILDLASTMLSNRDTVSPGLWSRAAVLLVRQALEECLEGYWYMRGIAVDRCTTRAQLICLREYLHEGDLASRVAHAWSALSRACHHHPYELPPTAEEIRMWIEPVRQLHAVVVRG